MDKIVSCPRCGKSVVWGPASPWRPFCSERCRLVDLGEWLDENHRIAGTADDPDEDSPMSERSPGAH
jgi:endogenous inhibitor of DNA gyrase (YacG/DUF329 family)